MDKSLALFIVLILIILPFGFFKTDKFWIIVGLLIVALLVFTWLIFSLFIQGRKIYFLETGIDFGRYYITGKGKIEMHWKSLFISYSQIKKIKIEPLRPHGKFVGRIDLISLRYFESMLEVYSQTSVYARPFSILQSRQLLDTVRKKKLQVKFSS